MESLTLQLPCPAVMGASWWHRHTVRVRELLARAANRVRLPGAVSNAYIDDKLTGQVVEISVGLLFTRISVNGRDYYFRRFSGTFDGTGSGCS